MHRIVIDTSVLVAALRSSRGASFRLIDLTGANGQVPWENNLSVALALEYEAIGKREARAVGIPESAIDDIVDTLCRVSRHHPIHFRLRPQSPDPDDDFLLELAFVARCDFIVTHNVRHLRSADQFGVSVVTPGAFLRKMEIRT